jgi:hypothetical protein
VRQWVTPRSLLLHLAFLVIASGCLVAAWWQVHRAMAGNTLSYLYSVEWPAFAVVAGIGWWQMFHDTPADIAERRAHHARARAASVEVVARTLPRSARAITVDSEESGPPRLAAAPAKPIGAGAPAGGQVPALAVSAPAASDTGPAPTGAPDAELLALEIEDDPDDELAAYNRYLATLAVRGRAKTWRNPRGL